MPYCKLEASFRVHPKFSKLARAMRVPRVTAQGHVACLWAWAIEHSPSGDLYDCDPEDIAEAACWGGDPHEFISACVLVGLLTETPQGYEIYRFFERNIGFKKAAAEKERRAKRKAGACVTRGPCVAPNRAEQSRAEKNIYSTEGDHTLTEPKTKKRKPKKQKSTETAPAINPSVQQVVDYYRARFPSRGVHLKPGHADWKLIADRLTEGFSVDSLCTAIDGNKIDPWHVEHGNHSVQYVFRNATKVEGFIANIQKNGAKKIDKALIEDRKKWVAKNVGYVADWKDGTDENIASVLRYTDKLAALVEAANTVGVNGGWVAMRDVIRQGV